MTAYRIAAIIREDLMPQLFPQAVRDKLETLGKVNYYSFSKTPSETELAEMVREADFAVTSWGSPLFTGRVAASAPNLKLVAHAAGSVKPVVSPEIFDMGILVVSAAGAIARYVAEMALGYTISLLRQLPQNSRQLKDEKKWRDNPYYQTDSLYEQTVGLVGLGLVARKFIELLTPFNVRLYGYDPYVNDETALKLGVTKIELDELLGKCRVISLHTALVPATRGMIDARRLCLIQNGAILINTARGALIDEAALAVELKTGRFLAALDSYQTEPLPADSPLRDIGDNLMLTPHSAGPAYYRRSDLSYSAVLDIERFIRGESIPNLIRKEMLESLA